MKPRQLPWKWLLFGLVVLILVGLVVLPRLVSTSSDLRDRVAAALSAWTGATVTLMEPLTVQYFPPLSLRGGLVATNTTKLPMVSAITAREFKVSLDLPELLMGRIKISALRLSQPKITLKDPVASADSPGQTPETIVADVLADAPVGVFRVLDGTIETSSGERLINNLDARFDVRRGNGALAALGTFDFRNESVGFSIDSGRASEIDGVHTAPVTLKVTSNPVTARFSGTAQFAEDLALDGDMLAEIGDARRFLIWMGVPLPEGESLRDLSASGDVHWSGSTLTFSDGTFSLDGNTADGLLAVRIGARPRVEGTLAFERLTLDPYLGVGEAAVAGDRLLDWVLLRYLDADLRISAGEILTSTMTLGPGGFTISAKDGAIASEVGELELCGGEATGRLGLNLSGTRTEASIVGKISDVAVEACLQPFASGVPVKGVGSLDADVSTGGTTWEELIRGLAGQIVVTGQNGAVPVDFSQLMASAGPDGSGWSHDSVTPFESLNADCHVSAGHVWCKLFNMQTGQGLVSGSGGVDVGRQTLDWDFLIADPVGPLNASQLVMETPPRVTIRGPLTEPLIQRANRTPPGDGATQSSPENSASTPR